MINQQSRLIEINIKAYVHDNRVTAKRSFIYFKRNFKTLKFDIWNNMRFHYTKISIRNFIFICIFLIICNHLKLSYFFRFLIG